MDQQQKTSPVAITPAIKLFEKLTDTVNTGNKAEIAKVWKGIRDPETMDLLVNYTD